MSMTMERVRWVVLGAWLLLLGSLPVGAVAATPPCDPGYYDVGGVCTPCPPGFYQPNPGETTCLTCPKGTSTALPASTFCTPCAPGEYQNVAGATTCNDCAPGSFSSASGSFLCTLCDLGEYQNVPGATTCNDCAPGFFSNAKGMVLCTPCALGEYQDSAAGTTCNACMPGTYQNQIGQTECLDCPGGSATPCSDNGVCDDGAGDGTCTCDEGFFGAVCADAEAQVSAKKLIVIDKLVAAEKAKVVYVSKDQTAGISKGSGTDPAAISATFEFGYDGQGGRFVIPSGSGWVANKPSVAKYVNKEAPGGETGVKVVAVKPGKLIKVVAKSLGDVPIDLVLAGPPVGDVGTSFIVVNGAETNRYCTVFAVEATTYKEIAGGTGRKLIAKGGVPGPCPENLVP